VLLEPLSRGETDDLIRELLGSTVLSEPFRARIADAADGNPLFVEEMLVMVRERSFAVYVSVAMVVVDFTKNVAQPALALCGLELTRVVP